MVELVFYKDGKEIRKMNGDGVVAATRDKETHGVATVGKFTIDGFLQTMSSMAVKITRAFFKTEKDSPADRFAIDMLIAAIKTEADHANMEEVKE